MISPDGIIVSFVDFLLYPKLAEVVINKTKKLMGIFFAGQDFFGLYSNRLFLGFYFFDKEFSLPFLIESRLLQSLLI